jgi:hypothetical protein
VIAVGPLFILCLAWRPTARFFDSWLSMVLNSVVLTWFAFFALGLSVYMGQAMVQVIQSQGGFLGPTFNVVGESLKYCVVMILMAIICFQAPSLASALTGGAAVQQGIQMIQNAMMVSGLRSASSARGAGAAVQPVVSCAPVPACPMPQARPRAPPPRHWPGSRRHGRRCRRRGSTGIRRGANRRLQARRPARPGIVINQLKEREMKTRLKAAAAAVLISLRRQGAPAHRASPSSTSPT